MNTLLPDFSQAIFQSKQSVDNQYFPLTPGTVFSYQGELYDTEEIVQAVTTEIAEEITEELGGEEFDDDNLVIDENLEELADEIAEKIDYLIDEVVDDVLSQLGDEIGAFISSELTDQITTELREDVIEELTGEEIELDEGEIVDDFTHKILEVLDDGIDDIAEKIAEEIRDIQEDLFGTESNQLFVTYDNKTILGVETIVVRDVAWDEGILVEDTFDWYAQDTLGNVWYLGEFATNYEYDDDGKFIGTNTDGSWEAGVDGALPGYLMPANPKIGDNYYQEFYPGEAEDEGEIVSLNQSISLNFGNYKNVLQTRDFTQLQPDTFEFKYYAPGVGQILTDEGITEIGGEPELSPELIEITDFPNINLPALSTAIFKNSTIINNPYFSLIPGTMAIYQGENINGDLEENQTETNQILVTEETKNILDIDSLVVQNQEFMNGVLTEDKLSYYAQDTEGNVWLLGEEIVEYQYNDQGNLINTDDSDSWLAGEGQSLPGLIMDGNPKIGEVYYQRYDIGEAENQAEIISLDAAVDNFSDYDNILQVKEFSTLEFDKFEYNYYAPGIGQVYTQELNEDGDVIFTSSLVSIENVNEVDF